MRRFGLLSALAGAAGRRSFDLPDGISVERDVAYGSDPAQRIDIYHPARAENAAIIMMVHGGGWWRGDKGGPGTIRNKVLHWVGGKGCLLASVNYRMVPAANPAQQGEDIGRALAFVQAQARTWGAEPARVVLMGHSAGAHLVSLVGADASLVTRFGGQPWLATIPIDSAAFDVEAIMSRPHFGLYDTAFGSDPALWREASPIHRLQGRPATPMLLVCSSRRSDSCPSAQEFAAKATRLGGQVKVLALALSHAEINDQLGAAGPYTAAVDDFLGTLGIR